MIRKVLGQIPFLVFIAVISLVLMEIGSRFLFPAWAPVSGDRKFWQYDPELGWSGVPDAKGRMQSIDFSVDVSLNSDGLRDSEYPVKRVAGKKRMLLMGDSFGWGFGVEQDEIFIEQIEARNEGWEIINASVSGYGTDQEYLYYVERGHRYQPDVVMLLFHAGNDFTNSASATQYWHNKPLFLLRGEELELSSVPVPGISLPQRLASYISANTYFLRMASSLVMKWRAAFTSAPSVLETGAPASGVSGKILQESDGVSRPLEAEERIVRLMLALNRAVREDGGRLVVIGTPTRNEVFHDARFLDSGIHFFSLSNIFRDVEERVVFEHDSHWNAAGHSILADDVERELREIGIFESEEDRQAR
ncbi:MAG: SGNH/GDSL hydrolase family protein [Myxococcota bacterium]